MPKKILVCAAHPDDEALGCGGAIARHADEGDTVFLIFVSDGVGSRSLSKTLDMASSERQDSANRAARILGARAPIFLNFPDQRLDTIPMLDLVQRIELNSTEIRPDIVYTHHVGDLNQDHRRVAEAVMVAFRPIPGSSVTAIYGFETLSSTEWAPTGASPCFVPARYVSITDTLDKKLEALRQYDFEMREFPHPRSYKAVEALALLRGSTVGVEAAEAFTVLREIVR